MRFKAIFILMTMVLIMSISAMAVAMEEVNLTPTVAYTNDTIIGYCNATESSGENVLYNWIWFRGASEFDRGNNTAEFAQATWANVANLSSLNTTKAEAWTLSCQAYNTSDSYNETWVNSSAITISNRPPDITSVTIDPTTAKSNDTLIGWCNATDIDADNIYYDYRWYNNTAEYGNGTSANTTQAVPFNVGNRSASLLLKTEIWVLGCQASDSQDVSGWTNSSNKTIQNTEPLIISSRIDPAATAYNNQTLIGYCNATDDDAADILWYNYQWYNNSALHLSGNTTLNYTQSGEANIANLSSGNLTDTDVWFLRCQAYDADAGYSNYLNSSVTRIESYVFGGSNYVAVRTGALTVISAFGAMAIILSATIILFFVTGGSIAIVGEIFVVIIGLAVGTVVLFALMLAILQALV